MLNDCENLVKSCREVFCLAHGTISWTLKPCNICSLVNLSSWITIPPLCLYSLKDLRCFVFRRVKERIRSKESSQVRLYRDTTRKRGSLVKSLGFGARREGGRPAERQEALVWGSSTTYNGSSTCSQPGLRLTSSGPRPSDSGFTGLGIRVAWVLGVAKFAADDNFTCSKVSLWVSH